MFNSIILFIHELIYNSVEMLWKVTDYTITTAAENQQLSLQLSGNSISYTQYVAVIFDLMLRQLFHLSMDTRPLLRHCAMVTLFSAMYGFLDIFILYIYGF